MKKLQLLIYFILLCTFGSHAQYKPIWVKNYGEDADQKFQDVSFQNNLSILATGSVKNKETGKNAPSLVKISSGGMPVWEKIIDLPFSCTIETLVTDNESHIYLGGATLDDPYLPYTDFFLIKTNEKGDTLWSKIIKGPGYDRINHMKMSQDHNLFVGGFQDVQYYDEHRAVIMKLDTAGNQLWKYTYSGSSGEELLTIHATADGGVAFAGFERTTK
ncbi:MAG: hypothetical protein RIS47_2138, partial [Bacteroidota bacterium]